MGHTNSTANLALPQFIGTDKPTWLSDVNGAFAAIDAYAGNNDAALAITDAKADTAVNNAASAVTTATNAANTAGTASTQATNAVTVAGNALTVANGINSKVGVLTDLTTTDKSSVVNAINEVNAGLTAPTAAQVSYDNSGSGLTATNVQDAIDEVAQGGGGGTGTVVWTNSDSTQDFAAQAVNVDTSAYSEIEIEYVLFKDAQQKGSITIPAAAAGGHTYCINESVDLSNDLRIFTRKVTYAASAITFTDATAWTSFSAGTPANSGLVPTKIIAR